MKAYLLKISGKVQGVWYRVSAKKKAEEIGVNGYVQNQEDGSVKVVVEGQKEDVKKFIDWCKDGPEQAEVMEVDVSRRDQTGYRDFNIRR